MQTKVPCLVLSAVVKETKTGNKYSRITIIAEGDEAPNVVNVWGVSDKLVEKAIIKINAIKTKTDETGTFNSCSPSDVEYLSPSTIAPKILKELYKFLPPVPTETEWTQLIDRLTFIIKQDSLEYGDIFREICMKLYQPYHLAYAATTHHHAWQGGLLQHTYETLVYAEKLVEATPDYQKTKVHPFVVFTSAAFHDYAKLNEYGLDGAVKLDYMSQVGHVVGGSYVIGQVLASRNVDKETIQRCQHAILAHHGVKEHGSPVEPQTLDAFYVHLADAASGIGYQKN